MDNTRNDALPAALLTARGALYLTQEQERAALLWETKDTEEIAAALGIPSHVLTEWQDQPLFRAEVANLRMELDASTEEKQAAVLVYDNFSYAEAAIGLEEGTIIEWALDEDSPFNGLLEDIRAEYCYDLQTESAPLENTKDDTECHNLNEDQIRAIPLILEGKTDAQVGEAIGKSRETINRWRNQDKNFIAELKKAREAYLDSQIMALSAATRKAITTLGNLLDSEDEKIRMQVAIHLLKATALPQRIK